MTIKELRTAAGMTQKTFAEYFGIPWKSIQNWEYGRTTCPDYVVRLIAYKLTKENIISGE